MGVQFNQIPANLRVPLFYAEVNAGQNPYQSLSRTLVIGQKTAAGSAPADAPVILNGDATALFGAGSMLTEMAVWARQNHELGEIWALPVADPAGVAQTWTITIAAGIAGSAGTITVSIGGENVQVAVLTTDTNASVATALAAAINAGYTKFGRPMSFPVTASAATNVVTLTARNMGVLGATIGVHKDLVGDEGPLQTHLTIASGTAGTGTPSLATALANLGDMEFDWIIAPYADATTLNTIRDFLSESGGRWSPLKQIYGHYVSVLFDTYANLITLGSGRNDPNVSIMGVVNSPSPVWRWAAAFGAAIAKDKNLGAEVDQAYTISRPVHTLPLVGILPPKVRADQWDITERQSLYNNGIAGYSVGIDGTVRIDRAVTTYRTNVHGQPDITWLDVETRAQMVYIVRYLRQRVTQVFGRVALADDDPGQNTAVATPKKIRAELIAAYKELELGGIVEKTDLFARFLVVERSSDPNRVNVYLPVDVVNQLRVFAVNATTFLTYPAAA